MPGFLVFKELGLDFSDAVPSVVQGAIKTALSMLPGSWMLHGLGGEYNVDVDPVAELNKALDGEAFSGGITQFMEAYKGWVPVVSIQQSFTSEAEAERRNMEGELARQNEQAAQVAAEMASRVARQEIEGQVAQQTYDTLRQALPEADLSAPDTPDSTSSGNVFRTGMSGDTSGVERIAVEVHLDVSFPKLLKAALKPKGSMKTPEIFPSAEIHMCTTAAIDTRQLTMGSDSAAATLIQTLVGFLLYNIVPYLTISMKDVQVAEVSYDLLGDADGTTPTATVVLEYKEVTWSYHVINGSNMNLYSVDFSYDVRQRKPPSGGLSLGSMLNPFG